METGEKKQKDSSSSLTNDLVGEKGSSDSSPPGIFDAIFPHPTKEPLHFLAAEKKKSDFGSQESKTESSGGIIIKAPGVENDNLSMSEKDKTSKAHNPCHYSSSIYYGGQDVLAQPENTHNPTGFDKGSGEDDPNVASRGNWWQGSLYY